jgi:hypothetical protein
VHGGHNAGDVLLAVALGGDEGLEEGRITEPECGVAPKVKQHLPECTVRIGEGEESVQERIYGGAGSGGTKCNLEPEANKGEHGEAVVLDLLGAHVTTQNSYDVT